MWRWTFGNMNKYDKKSIIAISEEHARRVLKGKWILISVEDV